MHINVSDMYYSAESLLAISIYIYIYIYDRRRRAHERFVSFSILKARISKAWARSAAFFLLLFRFSRFIAFAVVMTLELIYCIECTHVPRWFQCGSASSCEPIHRRNFLCALDVINQNCATPLREKKNRKILLKLAMMVSNAKEK